MKSLNLEEQKLKNVKKLKNCGKNHLRKLLICAVESGEESKCAQF